MINNSIDTNEGIVWGISLRENASALIGYTSFWQIIKPHYRAEIGYTLDPRYWKKGIMYEANTAIINYAFNSIKLHSIQANINSDNKASEALLQKLGFVKEAHFKEDYYFEGRFFDSVVYSLLYKK
jgi:ribosomal-protein-alanine N-acetyltransferase